MKKLIFTLLATCALVSCSQNSDLDKWMQDQQQQAKNKKKEPEPIVPPVFKPYNPPMWEGLNSFDPKRMDDYRTQRAKLNEDSDQEKKPTQFLSTIFLDKLAYKGMIDFRPIAQRCKDRLCQGDGYKPCTTPRACYALVKNKDTQKTYKVTIGDAMGQNFGVITEINSRNIVLDEKEKRDDGEMVKKVTTMELEP